MKRFFILGFFLLLLLAETPVLGQFSQLNPPPPSTLLYPFLNSAATKRLPADKMNHLLVPAHYGISAPQCPYNGTSDGQCLAQNSFCWGNALNNSGCVDNFVQASPASDGTPGENDQNQPIYYTGAPDPNTGQNDPVYSMCGAEYSPNVCMIFHAPSNATGTNWTGGAYWTGGSRQSPTECQDVFFGVWDVTWNIFLHAYGCHNSGASFGIGTCPSPTHLGTAADPCPADGANGAGYTSVSAQQIGHDRDWNWGGKIRTATVGGQTRCCGGHAIAFGGSGDNAGFFAAGALLGRANEIMAGAIYHSEQGGEGCTNASQPNLFPSLHGISDGAACTTGSGEFQCEWCVQNGVLPGGAHVFLDYTDAQIAAMNLTPLQAAYFYQMAHYGTYVDNYSGSTPFGATLYEESTESGQGYYFQVGQQNPFYTTYLPEQGAGSTLADGESGYVGVIPITCGSNSPPTSQYRCELVSESHGYGMLYGMPLVGGVNVLGHLQVLDPSAEPVLATFGNSFSWIGGTLPAQTTGEIEIAIVGGGTVTSNPAGSDCDHTGYCEIGYATGRRITFTAIPNSGYTFAGWSGSGCSGTGTCTITTATGPAQQATARFLVIN
jgi:hypothetical protein